MNNVEFSVRLQMGGKKVELTDESFGGLAFNVRQLANILDDCQTLYDFDRRLSECLQTAARERSST